MSKFNVILSDNPWQYADTVGKRGADAHYATMSSRDLQLLRVGDLAAENCAHFMWVTAPFMPLGISLMQAYGFDYKTIAFVWVKMNAKAGTPFTGMGHYTRCLRGDTEVVIQRSGSEVSCVSMRSLGDEDLSDIRIWTHNGWRRINNWWKNDGTETVRVKVNGGEIVCSMWHKFPHKTFKNVCVGEKRQLDHFIDVKTMGDIASKYKTRFVQDGKGALNLLSCPRGMESDDPVLELDGFLLDWELGWLVGMFLAEGSFDKGRRGIRLSLHREEVDGVQRRVNSWLERYDIYNERYVNTRVVAHGFKNKGAIKNGAVYFSSGRVKSLLKEFVSGEGAGGKRVNMERLYQTPLSFRAGIWKGMMDGDGCVSKSGQIKLVLCNKGLIEDFAEIGRSIGHIVRVCEEEPRWKGGTKCFKYALYRYRRGTCSEFDFEGVPVDLRSIDSIEPTGIVETTYDIEVDGGYFIANGLIVHNSNCEYVLMGLKGKMARQSASVHSIVMSPLRKHSTKPPEVRERIMELFGDVPRVELFAREKCTGWTQTGLEFDGLDVREFIEKHAPLKKKAGKALAKLLKRSGSK